MDWYETFTHIFRVAPLIMEWSYCPNASTVTLKDMDKSNSIHSQQNTAHLELHAAYFIKCSDMMTSSNGNIFGVTGHLCGEFTGPR